MALLSGKSLKLLARVFTAFALLLGGINAPALAADDIPDVAAGSPEHCGAADCITMTPAEVLAAADHFVEQGNIQAARSMLSALLTNRALDIRAEANFRLGQIEEREGNKSAAARRYRAVLDAQPDATRVRLDLARVLAEMGQIEAARDQVRRANTRGLPEAVARSVERFRLSLRSLSRKGASLQISIAPDSNVVSANNASSVLVGSVPVELRDEARAHSGLGLAVNAEAFWRPRLGDRENFIINLAGSAELYTYARANDIDLVLSAGPEFVRGPTRWRPMLRAEQRWFGQRPFNHGWGANLNVQHSLGAKSQIQVDLTGMRRFYPGNRGLDGTAWLANVRFDRALSPRFVVRLGARAGLQGARLPAYANRNLGTDIIVSRDFGKQSAFARASLTKVWGRAPFLFPPDRREDWIADMEVGLSTRKVLVAGLTPSARLRYTQSWSPIFFYAFNRVKVEFGLSREF